MQLEDNICLSFIDSSVHIVVNNFGVLAINYKDFADAITHWALPRAIAKLIR